MKLNLKKLLSISILLILSIWIVIFILLNIEEFKELTLTSPWLILILAGLFFIEYILVGMSIKVLLRPLFIDLGFAESSAVSFMTSFYNLITPFKGGFAARAVYLNRKHRFSYTDFVAAISANYIILFFTAGILGVIVTSILFATKNTFQTAIFFLFLLIILISLSLIFFYRLIPYTKNKFLNYFIAIINSYYILRKDKKAILLTFLISFLQLMVLSLILLVQFKIFGRNLSLLETLFLASINTIGVIFAITPAGLGVEETVTVFSALTLGIGPVTSLSAALIGRAVSLIILIILGPIASYFLFRAKPYHQRINPRKTESVEHAYKDLRKAYEKTKNLKEEFIHLKNKYSRKRKGVKVNFESRFKRDFED